MSNIKIKLILSQLSHSRKDKQLLFNAGIYESFGNFGRRHYFLKATCFDTLIGCENIGERKLTE